MLRIGRCLKRRPKCGRQFGVASFAPVMVLATTGRRCATVTAFGANGTIWPTNPVEILPTPVIIRKLLEQSHDRHAET
jgi:hypothetical protein